MFVLVTKFFIFFPDIFSTNKTQDSVSVIPFLYHIMGLLQEKGQIFDLVKAERKLVRTNYLVSEKNRLTLKT